jgi:acylglycerol lipase
MTDAGTPDSGYEHATATCRGARDVRLFRQYWRVRDPRARLVVAHGLGEHSGRYQHVAEALAGHRISIAAQDHRGHGRSEGRRGHVDRFDDYVVDLGSLVDAITTEHGGRAPYLMGHSLGGVIAARFALAHPERVAGLILSSPGFVACVSVPAWKAWLGRWCSRLVPTLSMSSGIAVEALTHDPEVRARFNADPLVHGVASARWYTEFLAAARDCLERAPELTMPLLAFHGTLDSVVASSGTELFVGRARSADKTITLFPGLSHETMNETEDERRAVLDHVVAWLDRRVPTRD